MTSWKTINRHPLSAEYRDITGPAWFRFVLKMKRGFMSRFPIILHEGMVLDGWQRLRACIETDIEPAFDVLPEGADPAEYVETVNDERRHETALEAAERVAARVKRVAEARAEGKTLRTIAKEEGVSHETIRKDAEAVVNQLTTDSESPETSARPDVSNSSGPPQPPEPPKVTGSDGKKYDASKPKPTCEKCTRAKRVGQKLPRTCAECKELRKKPKAAEPSKEPDDKAWVDGWGIPITKKAEKAFLDQEKFAELVSVLRKAKAMFKELADSPGGAFLQQSFVSDNSRTGFVHRGLETCIMNVQDCKPKYTVCPYAYADDHKHDKTCNMCHGLGWLCSVSKSSGLPEALIDAAKKANGVS